MSSTGKMQKLLLTRHLPCLFPTCLHNPRYSSFCSFITSVCQETRMYRSRTSWFSDV